MADPYLKGQWNELKGRFKEKWGELTNDDLDRGTNWSAQSSSSTADPATRWKERSSGGRRSSLR